MEISEKDRKNDASDIITSKNPKPLFEPQQPNSAPPEPYSTFTKAQKRLIVFLIAFAGMFSPLSSFIYYPAITSLSRDLHVSVELVNLTITSYMIVSGIAPAIIGDLADMTGRRWVYILTLATYCAADVGLALQRSWPALLLLRMLQSLGSSGVHAPLYEGEYVANLIQSYYLPGLRRGSRYCKPCRKRLLRCSERLWVIKLFPFPFFILVEF